MLEIKFYGALGFRALDEFIDLFSPLFRLIDSLFLFILLLIFELLDGKLFLFEFGCVVKVD